MNFKINQYKTIALYNHFNYDILISINNILNKKKSLIFKFRKFYNMLFLLNFKNRYEIFDYLHNFYILSCNLSQVNNYKYILQSLYLTDITHQMFTHNYDLYEYNFQNK
jgi:hypothetical protein